MLRGAQRRGPRPRHQEGAKDDSQKQALSKDNGALHPVVRTHPVTGRKALLGDAPF